MLTINIPEIETVSNENEIIKRGPWTLQMEHSLISISKWESEVGKPFLDDKSKKSSDELKLYFKCMTIGKIPPDEVYSFILNNKELIDTIQGYMEHSNTSLVFPTANYSGKTSEPTPSELIYYWLVALQIPFEVEKWHIRKLLAFIRLTNAKQNPDNKKYSRGELIQRQAAINAANRAMFNSKG